MKILYLGHTGKHASDHYRTKGMFDIGFDVYFLDYRTIAKTQGHDSLLAALVHAIYMYEPDAVLVNKGEIFQPEHIVQLRKYFPEVIWLIFYGDIRERVDGFLQKNLRFYDALLINADDEEYHKKFTKFGIRKIFYHHTATDPEIFEKKDKFKEVYDIGFFGGNYYGHFPNSKERFDIIHALMGKYRVLIHGSGWGAYAGKHVYGDQYVEQTSKCKILLCTSNFNNVNKYTSNRTWNSMACGFVIHQWFNGIEKIFKNKHHLIWFHQIKQLYQIVDYYLEHPEKRKEIYQNGRNRIISKHSYKVRAKELKSIINQLRGN